MKLLSSEVIRRCLIADPSMSIFTADYDQIELRVIAALANEPAMIEAAKKGESLHLLAANRLFGIDHTPDQYKLAKNVNFTWAFGGSADVMNKRYGIPIGEAWKLIKDYEAAFPSLVLFKRRQQEKVLRSALSTQEYKVYKSLLGKMFSFRNDTKEGKAARKVVQLEISRLCYRKVGYITTEFGRRLMVDAEKPYTGINYEVQGTAADIMKQGFLRIMEDKELAPTVLLPVHDELVGQGPKKKALYLATRYGEVMSTEFKGVPITASGKVYGKSWGHGYKKEAA
jgi:DNA polymerase-1